MNILRKFHPGFLITVSFPGSQVTTRIYLHGLSEVERVVDYCIREGYRVLVREDSAHTPTDAEMMRADCICVLAGLRSEL